MTRSESKLVRQAFEGYELHKAIGLELVECGTGNVMMGFRPDSRWRNPPGSEVGAGGVHGGLLATVLDAAACFAVTTMNGVDVGTIGLSVEYLRPALDSEFVVRGNVNRVGKRIAWSESSVSDASARVIAIARAITTW